jgi:flagellar biosynthesis protein
VPKKKLAKFAHPIYDSLSFTVKGTLMSEKDDSTFRSKNNESSTLSTTTPENYAVALGYNQAQDNAPKVLAKGQGEVAERIVALAKEHDIEIRQDADLLQILKAVDINQEIPLEAFAAVAEIISYIYQKNAHS